MIYDASAKFAYCHKSCHTFHIELAAIAVFFSRFFFQVQWAQEIQAPHIFYSPSHLFG
jgi:hypothetical protein